MLFKDICYVDDSFAAKHGSVLVEGDKIKWIGTGTPENYSGEIYDGKDKVMLPGFFNIHCHVPMVLLRGYGEGLPLQRWLEEKVFPFEGKLDSNAIYWSSLMGMAEMIKSGAVGFTDMYFLLEDIARATDVCGIKANLSNGALTFSGEKYTDTRSYRETEWLKNHIKTLSHDRITCDASLHAEYTSNPDFVVEIAQYAKDNGMRMHVHVSETAFEHNGCKERRDGLTPAQYLAKLGLFDVPATAAHCVFAEDADFEIFREKGVTVSHNPSSNLKLGSGIAPVWKMHQAGVNVGIGTDGASSNNNLNMLEEVTLASLVQKGANRDPMCMDTASTLKMASLNGAKSQGREDCGAIKVGNRADLAVYDMDKPHLQPVFDAVANILYAASASDICLTMVDGRTLYKNGEFLTVDIEKVVAECRSAQQKVLSQL